MIREEFGISQPGVSQHLRVLRESGFTTVRTDGTRRLYAVNSEPLDALATELARGKRERRLRQETGHARHREPPEGDPP